MRRFIKFLTVILLIIVLGGLMLHQRKPKTVMASPLDSYTDFSMEFTSRIGLGEKNTAVSPYSVYMAMLMLTEGSSGDTRDELMKALRISSLEDARSWFNMSTKRFTDVKDAKAEIANSIWVKSEFPVSRNYLSIVKQYYNAEQFSFVSPSDAVPRINEWVSNKTNKLIDRIVERLDPLTMIVLVNTVYFKANWTMPFEYVEKGEFHSLNGTKTADYLRGRVQARYVDAGDHIALALSYKGTDVNFVVLMPKGDLKGFLNSLGRGGLIEVFDKLFSSSEVRVDLSLPKFDVDSGILDLNSILKSMGIKKVFIPGEADLSPMVEGNKKRLYVDEVLHRARVKVDLYGTEAAAATAVAIKLTAVSSAIPLKIDRPFAFFLVDPKTKAILFAGSFVSP